ncbi:uncharacterized protein LOC115049935 isoform X2 [Echeneis naucrates]|uniref:uncharacterized protein LOC115049935 isoform X2 n=1 Tax=Echeneis naucrates TaxID=173247 RepID=UPI00111447A9|nr:uncharacterized protein LOC115049935 isoform X2 [Echeneis naucrates]
MIGNLAALILLSAMSLIQTAEVPRLISLTEAKTDWNQQKHVKQSPETASVHLGDPVTLRCSLFYENERNKVPCPAENSVYWFRAGSGGFHPGVIYPQRSDEEEERSCVYSLSKTILNSSDAGIYYCAVVTCGEILFGGGTTVETKSGLDPVVLVLGGLLVCCVTAIAVLIFCGNQRVCKHVEGAGSASHHSGHGQTNNVDDEGLSYAALSFSSKRTKRLRKTNESQQECTYSEYIG